MSSGGATKSPGPGAQVPQLLFGEYMYVDIIPANTKYLYNIYTMLDQRRRHWAGIVEMLYKCFVFAGIISMSTQ